MFTFYSINSIRRYQERQVASKIPSSLSKASVEALEGKIDVLTATARRVSTVTGPNHQERLQYTVRDHRQLFAHCSARQVTKVHCQAKPMCSEVTRVVKVLHSCFFLIIVRVSSNILFSVQCHQSRGIISNSQNRVKITDQPPSYPKPLW